MLTETSVEMIHHFLGKTSVKSLLGNKTIYQLYQNINQDYTNTTIKLSHMTGKFPESDFIGSGLKSKLQQRDNFMCLKWTTNSKYSVQNTLNIYLDENDKPDTKLLVDAISFITSFSDRSRKITVHLCLLPDNKIIRKNQTKIGPNNVNSGSNQFSETESEICIFRQEEVIKVIFHEIIHGLCFSKLGSNEEITEILCHKYNLESKDILIDESYTEIWAKILNCYFISSLTDSQNKFQHFCTILAVEHEFSIYQANKVKQFIKNSKYKNLDKNTNVSAYYLVVGEIFNDFTGFIQMCGNQPYIRNTNTCLEYLYQLDKFPFRRVSQNDNYYNTMRMSVSELEV